MFRASVCAACLVLACQERPKSVEVTEVPVRPAEEGRVIDLTAAAGGRLLTGEARELRPREGHDGCVEMYTVCMPEVKGENCTSARLELECGETGKIPSTGEQVKCACL